MVCPPPSRTIQRWETHRMNRLLNLHKQRRSARTRYTKWWWLLQRTYFATLHKVFQFRLRLVPKGGEKYEEQRQYYHTTANGG